MDNSNFLKIKLRHENLNVAADILKFINEYGIHYMQEDDFIEMYHKKHLDGADTRKIKNAICYLEKQGIVEKDLFLLQKYYQFNNDAQTVKDALMKRFQDDGSTDFIVENEAFLWKFIKECFSAEKSMTLEEFNDFFYKALRKEKEEYHIDGRTVKRIYIDTQTSKALAEAVLWSFEAAGIITLEGNLVNRSPRLLEMV